MRAIPSGDRARQWGRQTDQRKEGGMGGRRVPGALKSSKQEREAPSWGLAIHSGLREGGGDTGLRRGTHHGSARGRVRRSGGRGRACHRLPPAARVSPGLARGQLRPRWRLGQLGLPGRGAPPGRVETAAPPRPALQCPPPPPRRTPSRDSLSRALPLAAPPTPPPDMPSSPATLFFLLPALQPVAPTLTLGGPSRRGRPSFPATA